MGVITRAGDSLAGVGSFSEVGGGVVLRAGSLPGWRWPTVWPTFTSVPSGTRISRVPSVSAKTSEVTLSVSISKRGSPEATDSPFFRFQVPRVPEVMDSPTEGMRMGMREVAVLIVIFFQSYFSVSFGGWEKFS